MGSKILKLEVINKEPEIFNTFYELKALRKGLKADNKHLREVELMIDIIREIQSLEYALKHKMCNFNQSSLQYTQQQETISEDQKMLWWKFIFKET